MRRGRWSRTLPEAQHPPGCCATMPFIRGRSPGASERRQSSLRTRSMTLCGLPRKPPGALVAIAFIVERSRTHECSNRVCQAHQRHESRTPISARRSIRDSSVAHSFLYLAEHCVRTFPSKTRRSLQASLRSGNMDGDAKSIHGQISQFDGLAGRCQVCRGVESRGDET